MVTWLLVLVVVWEFLLDVCFDGWTVEAFPFFELLDARADAAELVFDGDDADLVHCGGIGMGSYNEQCVGCSGIFRYGMDCHALVEEEGGFPVDSDVFLGVLLRRMIVDAEGRVVFKGEEAGDAWSF